MECHFPWGITLGVWTGRGLNGLSHLSPQILCPATGRQGADTLSSREISGALAPRITACGIGRPSLDGEGGGLLRAVQEAIDEAQESCVGRHGAGSDVRISLAMIVGNYGTS